MTLHALTHLLGAAAFAAVLLATGYLALRSSLGTVVLLLAVWVATSALRESIDLSMTLSEIRISVLDALSVLLAVVGVSRALTLGVGNAGRGLALALLVLLGFHIARGLPEFGMQVAVNDARGWLYFTSTLVYAATIPGGWDSRIWKLFVVVGVLLAVVALGYLLVDGLPTLGSVLRNGQLVASRPVFAGGALLMLQTVILATSLGWPSKTWAFWIAAGSAVLLVLLQHRTLWVAGIAVALVCFFSWSARRVRDAPSTVFAATGLVLLALPVAVWAFVRTGPLISASKEAVSSDSTFTWRTTSWSELIKSHHSVSDLASGGVAGANWNRLFGGHIVTASPHDGFVDAYLRFGLPGVLALVGLGFLLWRRRATIATATGLTALAVGLLVLTQLAYSITYNLDSIQGVITGILVSGLALSHAQARAPQTPRQQPALVSERRLAGR